VKCVRGKWVVVKEFSMGFGRVKHEEREVKIAHSSSGDWTPLPKRNHVTRAPLAGLSLTWKSGIAEMVQTQPACKLPVPVPNSKAAQIIAVEEEIAG
jgi:hypothetical protein